MIGSFSNIKKNDLYASILFYLKAYENNPWSSGKVHWHCFNNDYNPMIFFTHFEQLWLEKHVVGKISTDNALFQMRCLEWYIFCLNWLDISFWILMRSWNNAKQRKQLDFIQQFRSLFYADHEFNIGKVKFDNNSNKSNKISKIFDTS